MEANDARRDWDDEGEPDDGVGGGAGAPSAGALAALGTVLGCVGLLGGARGAFDAFAYLAWLALAGPAIGALLGALGLRLWPAGWIAPGAWMLVFALVAASGEASLPEPAFAIAVVAGMHLVGLAMGAVVRRRSCARRGPVGAAGPERSASRASSTLTTACATSGALLLASLLLSGVAIQGALPDRDESWGVHHPEATTRLLDASPLVVAFEAAGLDWVHAHPDLYARSGIESIPRRPYRGSLAAPLVLLVGSLFAFAATLRPS